MAQLEARSSEIAGYDTHSLECGDAEDALVWFPALLDCAASFGRTMLALARRVARPLRMIAVDPPGYGKSQLRPGQTLPSFSEWQGWCEQLVDRLERDVAGRMLFVGNSSGGVGATLAAVHAQRCAGLVLACWCDWRGHEPPNTGALCPVDVSAARELLARSFFVPPPVSNAALLELVREARDPAFVAHVASFDAHAYRELLARYRGPLHLIGGDSDRLVPEPPLRALQAERGASLQLVPECGHYPQRERPRELASALAVIAREVFAPPYPVATAAVPSSSQVEDRHAASLDS